MHNSTPRQNTCHKISRQGFYDNLTERILSNQYSRSVNQDLLSTRISSFNEGSSWRINESKGELGSLHEQESWRGQSKQNPICEINSLKLMQQKVCEHRTSDNRISITPQKMDGTTSFQRQTTIKRKASDCNLDLNLSLASESRDDEKQKGLQYDESRLSLSLYTPSLSKLKKLKEDDNNARGASTLDLTL